MKRKREANILEKTFKDHLNVYRKEMKVHPQTKESIETETLIYAEKACALSQGSSSTPERQEFHSEKQMDMVIFTPPGLQLLENDRAEIVTEAGQSFHGKTGRTFSYISHGETPFKVEGIT